MKYVKLILVFMTIAYLLSGCNFNSKESKEKNINSQNNIIPGQEETIAGKVGETKLLTSEEVVEVLLKEGFYLTEIKREPYIMPEFTEVVPFVFLVNNSLDRLFIYAFDSIKERWKFFNNAHKFETVNYIAFLAKNTAIFYVPEIEFSFKDLDAFHFKNAAMSYAPEVIPEALENAIILEKIILDKLNDAKEVKYYGESFHWAVELLLRYYDDSYYWEDDAGFSRKIEENKFRYEPTIKYKETNVNKVVELALKSDYFYFESIVKGLPLDDKGYVKNLVLVDNYDYIKKLLYIGDPSSIESNKIEVIISWNEKEETVELVLQQDSSNN